jgi:hypothetical protein
VVLSILFLASDGYLSEPVLWLSESNRLWCKIYYDQWNCWICSSLKFLFLVIFSELTIQFNVLANRFWCLWKF